MKGDTRRETQRRQDGSAWLAMDGTQSPVTLNEKPAGAGNPSWLIVPHHTVPAVSSLVDRLERLGRRLANSVMIITERFLQYGNGVLGQRPQAP